MFKRFKSFVKTTVLGGVIVILPVTILVLVFQWVYRLVVGMIRPLSSLIAQWIQPATDVLPYGQLQGMISDSLTIVIILSFCFVVGVAVKTRLGGWLFHTVEHSILRVAPGYTTIKEIILQFSGAKKTPFSRVALIRVFNSDIQQTGFITDEHADGSYTVFVPTAPNPTSGWFYHAPAKDVRLVNASVEATMRSILSCGVGSKALLAEHFQNPQ